MYALSDTSPDVRIAGRFMGAHNALGSLLAVEAKFDGVWISGLEVSASRVVPDTEIISLTEMLDVCRQVSRACSSIPILVDGDTGYGDALNFAYAAQEFGRAGAMGVCIEDKVFPKRNSFSSANQSLADVDDFLAKIDAAVHMRGAPQIIARTEALILGLGVDVALERARQYADAGAHAVLVHDKSEGGAEAIEFAQNWGRDVPVIAVPTTYYRRSYAELRAVGFDAVVYANQGLRASIGAMQAAMSAIIADDGAVAVEPDIVPISEVFRLQSRFTSDAPTHLLEGAATVSREVR